jgi:general stress protein 26
MSHTKLDEFCELIKKFNSGTLISLEEQDSKVSPVGRPMAIADVSEAAEISTISYRETTKVDQLDQKRSACFCFQDGNSLYVTATGPVSIIEDKDFKKTHWNHTFEAWFPDGIKDENVVALKLHPHKLEAWDSSGLQRAKYFYEIAKKRLQGGSPEPTDVGRHLELDLSKGPQLAS